MTQSNYDKTARELVAAGILELRETGKPTRYPYQERVAELEVALDAIAGVLSGASWDSDTLEEVASWVRGAGYSVQDHFYSGPVGV